MDGRYNKIIFLFVQFEIFQKEIMNDLFYFALKTKIRNNNEIINQ